MNKGLKFFAALTCAVVCGACTPHAETETAITSQPLSVEDQALVKRFSVLKGGGEFVIDSIATQPGVLDVLDEKGRHIEGGSFREGTNSKASYGSNFGVPKALRVIWRTGEGIRMKMDISAGAWEGGVISWDQTISVAERIPDELLEDLRKNGGGFRLKIRLHDEGVLVGWDIERRPNLKGFSDREMRERNIYLAPHYSATGGDFKEARLLQYGENASGLFWQDPAVFERGWYIHPKTGERIETDF
jgi:hypothetical protein